MFFLLCIFPLFNCLDHFFLQANSITVGNIGNFGSLHNPDFIQMLGPKSWFFFNFDAQKYNFLCFKTREKLFWRQKFCVFLMSPKWSIFEAQKFNFFAPKKLKCMKNLAPKSEKWLKIAPKLQKINFFGPKFEQNLDFVMSQCPIFPTVQQLYHFITVTLIFVGGYWLAHF